MKTYTRNMMAGLTLREALTEDLLDSLYWFCRKSGIFWIGRRIPVCRKFKWIISDMAWQEELEEERIANAVSGP